MAMAAGACLVGCTGGRPAPSAADHDRPRTGSGYAQVDAIALILPPVIVVRTGTSGFLHVVVGGISIRSLENPRDGGVVKHLVETAT